MKLHSKKRPEYLSSGEYARLIPFGSSGAMEAKVTSVFLATLASVREFSQSVLNVDGIPKIGARTKIDVWTEVKFEDKDIPENKKIRPDGLIVINTGQKQWKALVESKIGSNKLEKGQINNYLSLAKKHGIDAVITLSNQYVVDPRHHPIVKKQESKGRGLYHFSWVSILTHARLLLSNMKFADADQKFILTEMVRCFEDERSEISEFVNMNSEWLEVVNKIRRGVKIPKNSDEIKNTINAWHQESKNLCLIMSRKFDINVLQDIKKKHMKDPALRFNEDCEEFRKEWLLSCRIKFPNMTVPMDIKVSLKKRNVECSMSLVAPKDIQRSNTRLNWLLRDLEKTKGEDIFIQAISFGKAGDSYFELKNIRENRKLLSVQPVSFKIYMERDGNNKFGRKEFIKLVEDLANSFYEDVGKPLMHGVLRPPR